LEQVADIFKPLSHSAIDLFSDNGVIFQIPSYQRAYSWTNDNLERLLSDISDGLLRSQSSDALCFLGSIITVNLNSKINAAGCPLAIVDGQQRLTSLLLLFSVLENELNKKIDDLGLLLVGELKCWLNDELKDLKAKTRKCLFDDKDRDKVVYDLLPKITRQEDDVWGYRKGSYKYNSPVANYFFRYAEARHTKSKFEYFDPKFQHKDTHSLQDAVNLFVEQFNSKDFFVRLGKCEHLLSKDSFFFNLFSFDNKKITDEISLLNKDDLTSYESVNEIIQLIAFAKFSFNNIVITQVRTSESYQFDVFEALNTTGLPLTAFEIFRAAIISDKSDLDSDVVISDTNITSIDNIDKFSLSIVPRSRAKEMRDLVSSFVLYIEGIEPNEHLSWQRNKLLSLYKKSQQHNCIDRLIGGFESVANFRKNFWNKLTLSKQLDEFKDRDEALFYIDYFRESKSTLLIPILSRYLYNEPQKLDDFFNAIKALISFTLLWRLSHPDTSGIDTVYRDLMKKSYNGKDPLSLGIEKENNILPVSELRKILKSHLEKKKISVFESWKSKAKGVGIYDVHRPTARLALLLAFNDSKVEDVRTGLVIKEGVRSSSSLSYLKLSTWRDANFRTIEHIAPKNIKDATQWDNSIYSDGDFIPNSLGNLTLLPEAENNSVGNKPWDLKKEFYKCFIASTEGEIDEIITSLKTSGINVKKKAIVMMKKGEKLGVLIDSLSEIDKWDRKLIDTRNDFILKILWTDSIKELK